MIRAWAVDDPLLEGFAPWHWADEPSYGERMERGMRDMPETVSVYTELGLRIKHAAAAAAAAAGAGAAAAPL